jgi:nitrite reductase (NADH) small subunit
MVRENVGAEVEVHNVGPVDRIPLGEGRSYRIGCRDVAVFRSREGDLFATQADCPHRGGPLADGLTGAGKVVCPLHGMTFDLATGKPARATCQALRLYAVSVDAAREVLIEMEADAR